MAQGPKGQRTRVWMLSDSRRFMSDLEGQVTKMTKSGAMHRKFRTASVRAATWADAVAAPIMYDEVCRVRD